MYQLKTRETGADVRDAIERIAHPDRRAQAWALVDLFCEATGLSPRVWGEKQIGFGRYRYRYPSGHRGEYFVTGFAASGARISLYLPLEEGMRAELLGRLGKAAAGKACIYVNKLSDIDMDVLGEMISASVRFVTTEFADDDSADDASARINGSRKEDRA